MNAVPIIFLIEDDEAEAELIKSAIADPALVERLIVINNGEEALKMLHREPPYHEQMLPGLVFLDLHLPTMDGHQVLKDIRSNRGTQHIPVIVFTGSSEVDEFEKVYAEDANCVIRKPTNSAEFLRTVKTMANFWLKIVTLPPGDQYR